MRTFGRVPVDPLAPNGAKRWVVVQTDRNGFNDAVYLTALAQTLKLNLSESPFWANFGIPARASVNQQIPPDFYVAFTQAYYSQFFASLIITKERTAEPTYRIDIVAQSGAIVPPFRMNMAPV